MAIETVPEDEIPLAASGPIPGFADYLPEMASDLGGAPSPAPEGFLDAVVDLPDEAAIAEAKAEKKEHRKRMSRKMKKTMERFQGMFSSGIGNWFHQQAVTSGHPEWELDTEDKELIGDSIDFVMDAFNVEFDFEPVNITLTSVWWTMLYPLCAFGIVFLNKKSAVDRKAGQDAT